MESALEFPIEEATGRCKLVGFSIYPKERGRSYTCRDFLDMSVGTFMLDIRFGFNESNHMGAYLGVQNAENDFYTSCDISLINQSTGEKLTHQIKPDSVQRGTDPLVASLRYKKTSGRWVGNDSVECGWYGVHKLLPLKDLTKPDSPYIKDDTLTFEVTVRTWPVEPVVRRAGGAPRSAALANSPGPHQTPSIGGNLWKLQQAGKQTDVVLRPGNSSDGPSASPVVPVRAHRVVLAAQSAVFERMLFGGLGNAAAADLGGEGEVTLPDMDAQVLQWFLKYVYTDTLDPAALESDEALCHLFAAGHRYEVMPLLARCEGLIAERLTAENAAERLMMADLLEAAGLRARVLRYISFTRERLARVQATESFDRLVSQRPRLLAEIMAQVVPPAAKKRKAGEAAEELPENLDALRMVELKQLLSDRNLTQSGAKAELIARLREHARANRADPQA